MEQKWKSIRRRQRAVSSLMLASVTVLLLMAVVTALVEHALLLLLISFMRLILVYVFLPVLIILHIVFAFKKANIKKRLLAEMPNYDFKKKSLDPDLTDEHDMQSLTRDLSILNSANRFLTRLIIWFLALGAASAAIGCAIYKLSLISGELMSTLTKIWITVFGLGGIVCFVGIFVLFKVRREIKRLNGMFEFRGYKKSAEKKASLRKTDAIAQEKFGGDMHKAIKYIMSELSTEEIDQCVDEWTEDELAIAKELFVVNYNQSIKQERFAAIKNLAFDKTRYGRKTVAQIAVTAAGCAAMVFASTKLDGRFSEILGKWLPAVFVGVMAFEIAANFVAFVRQQLAKRQYKNLKNEKRK